LPIEGQDVVGLFVNAHSIAAKATLFVLAVCVAPVTEELVFRAGLFRYLRTRFPRRVSLLGPALIFGALHVDWKSLDGLAAFAPLTVLGMILSLAYERTGRIGTAIVAHALFNLNTILLLLAGVNV
jgi:membrane protease YdiL (CAAX protease family)